MGKDCPKEKWGKYMETGELQALITRCREGDRTAQEKLILVTQERVYFHCQKLLKHKEDAQDAAQDVLICMLENLKELRDIKAFWSWLNQMTVNICLKRLSKKYRELRLEEDEAVRGAGFFETPDRQETPDKALDNAETRRMVKELVDALPEAQRLCVLLYYYDEMSVREIAGVMGTSEGTVKSRLYYARRSIREGVDRYARQGLKLYGMPILPFLAYFLQKEAEALPVSGLISVGEVLAAAGGTALAAGSGTGAAVTAGTAASVLAHKGIAVLAVMTLAGAVTGGVLLRQPRQAALPPEPAAASAYTDRTPAPPPVGNLPVRTPVPDAPAVPELPEAVRTTVNPASPAVLPEEPDAPGLPLLTASEGTASLLAVLSPWEPEEIPETEEQPEQPQNSTAQEPEDRDSDGDSSAPPLLSPNYFPNPDFGSFLGEHDGVFEFAIEIQANQRRQPFPLANWSGENSAYRVRSETSDRRVVDFDHGCICGMNTGTAEVRYYILPWKEFPKEVEVLVHVTVVDRKPPDPEMGILLNPACGAYQGQDNGVHIFQASVLRNETRPSPLLPGDYFTYVECTNGTLVGYGPEGFRGLAPGRTDVRYYTAETEAGPYKLTAIVYVTVLEEASTSPAEVLEQSFREGYGYTGELRDIWPEMPAGRAEYTSSNPEVACVAAGGLFSTLTPGKAVITAVLDSEPEKQYVLTVQVDDRFCRDDRIVLPDFFFAKGETRVHGLSEYPSGIYDDLLRIDWTSSDPSIVSVEAVEGLVFPMTGRLTALAPGTVELRGVLSMRIQTCIGYRLMQTEVSCQVTVKEPAEERKTLTLRRGYQSSAAKEWQGLPGPLNYTSSAPDVVYIDSGGVFSVLEAGEAVLTAENLQGDRWVLEIQAVPAFDWDYDLPDLELWEGEEQPHNIQSIKLSQNIVLESMDWTSSDPGAVSVRNGELRFCHLSAIAPGTAVVTVTAVFQVDTVAGPRMMEDTASFQVTVKSKGTAEDSRQRTLTEFGVRSGCGCYSAFAAEWRDPLPENLTYRSSDPSVVYIGTNGVFQTLAPGTAVLTATDPEEPEQPYELTVTVREGVDWTRGISPLTLSVGEEVYHQLDSGAYEWPVELLSAHWTSSDPEVAAVTDAYKAFHLVQGVAPGTAEITGVLDFLVELLGEETPFQETVSYTVTVQ